MGFRKLLPLVVLVAIVVVILVIRNLASGPDTTRSTIALEEMVPDELTVSDVQRVEIVPLGQPDKAVSLRRKDDGWVLTSLYGAPADADKVESLVKELKKTRGELRASNVSAEKLDQWDLGEADGLAVKLFTAEGDKPAAGLVLGKSAEKQYFARRLEGDDVYALGTDVKSSMGLWSPRPMPGMPAPEEKKLPESSYFMSRQVLKLDTPDQVRTVKLTWPDKSAAFKKVEQPVKPDEAKKDDTEGEKKDEPKTEWVWTATAGGPGQGSFKPEAVTRMIESLARGISATDAVDPAQRDQWGMVDPSYRCELTLADGKTIVVLGGRPEVDQPGYIRLEGAEVVYKVSSYDFEQVFPRGIDLFALDVKTPEKDKLTAVKATSDGDTFAWKKTDDGWTLSEPTVGLEPRTAAAETVVDKIVALRLTGYADGKPADYGLAEPWASVTWTTAEGKTGTLKIGAPSKTLPGRYVVVEGKPGVYVISDTDAEAMKLSRFDAFSDAPVNVEAKTVTSYAVTDAKQNFVLKKTDEAWSITSGGKTTKANAAEVGNLLTKLNQLRADEYLDRQKLDKPARVTVTRSDGKPIELTVDIDNRIVRIDGVAWDVKLGKQQVMELFPTVESLKVKTPEN